MNNCKCGNKCGKGGRCKSCSNRFRKLSLATKIKLRKNLERIRIKKGEKNIKNKGNRNGMWKGDDVRYNALHAWITRNKLKPEFCEYCKIRKPYDLANISGEYKRDIGDYKWLCRGCHMKMDYKNGVRNGK